MKDVMGIIYTGEKDSFLRELTLQRAIAAVPVAGRYRVIDFSRQQPWSTAACATWASSCRRTTTA